jgi:hypothetical protein
VPVPGDFPDPVAAIETVGGTVTTRGGTYALLARRT